MALTPDDIFKAHRDLAIRHSAGRVRKAPRKKKSASPENAIVKACLQYLQILGCFVWRNNTGAFIPYSDSNRVIRYGKKGSGDIIGMTPAGRFISVECKFGRNEQSALQEDFEQRVKNNRGIYIVAYSISDIEARKADICQ